MTIDLETMLQLAAKALPLALSFVDDLFLFILVKLGVAIPGLSWIGPLLLTATLLFYIGQWLITFRNRQSSEIPCTN